MTDKQASKIVRVFKGRRLRHNGVCLLFFLTFLLLFSIANATLGNWKSFRGNPQLTGVADSLLPDNPQLLWTFQAGDMIESTAAIVDGTVYIGALDGILYAIDARTGEKQWTYQANGSIKASPAIHNGIVYFGDGDGVFHAVDISTRKMKWQFSTEGEIISSANFAGDRVLFGSYDGFLYCLNRESGELVWKFETEGYVHGTPGVWAQSESASGDAANFVILTGCDSYLRVINIDDGTQTQQVDLGAYVGASPAISQDQVYCGTYGTEILGIALDSGRLRGGIGIRNGNSRSLPQLLSLRIALSLVDVIKWYTRFHGRLANRYGLTPLKRVSSLPLSLSAHVFFLGRPADCLSLWILQMGIGVGIRDRFIYRRIAERLRW